MATREIERGASPRRWRAIRRQERASVVRSEADYAPRFQKKAGARPRTPTCQSGAVLVPCCYQRAVGFIYVDDLFRRADVVSLHCPLTPATERLVSVARLELMKPSALLLNTSRGPLVDNQALAEALAAGQIAGAGLDVLDIEPPPADNLRLQAPNCLITLRIAWYARASRQRLIDIAEANRRTFVEGTPVNTVG